MTAALLALALAATDPRLAILDAMGQELERTSTRLRLESDEAPYDVGFQVRELELQREARALEPGPALPSPWQAAPPEARP